MTCSPVERLCLNLLQHLSRGSKGPNLSVVGCVTLAVVHELVVSIHCIGH